MQNIWVLLSLERELGNPTERTSQPRWSQHFPCSEGEGPSRGSMQPCAKHPQLQLPVPSISIPHPALKHQPQDKASTWKPARRL